jgi:predicted GH43/DUF377 family glycosyl hydrolase
MQTKYLATIIIYILIFTVSPIQAQIHWTRNENNPILPTWGGSIDDPSGYKYTLAPSVLYDSNGNIYKCWFGSLAYGYGTSFSISSAISMNGIEWYVYSKNPILTTTPGTFDGRNIDQAYVIHDQEGYKMYYNGYDNISNKYGIGLATSQDGIHWQKYAGNPILTGKTDLNSWEKNILYPVVYLTEGGYFMYYTGTDGLVGKTGLAVSDDGITWTRYAQNPVLSYGASRDWDEKNASCAAICKVDSIWYMLYLGSGNGSFTKTSLGLATSTDGINWNKSKSNPIMVPTSYSSWEDYHLGRGTLLFRNNMFHFWYCAENYANGNWQVGYATSVYEPLSANIQLPLPSEFKVHQNYPNPFNPSTVIQYDVPSRGRIKVTVFDILGREVRQLIDEEKDPGLHQIIWDGKANDGSISSNGVYFSRIDYIRGSEVESSTSIKMVFVK